MEEEGGRAWMGRRTAASFVDNPLTGTGTGGEKNDPLPIGSPNVDS